MEFKWQISQLHDIKLNLNYNKFYFCPVFQDTWLFFCFTIMPLCGRFSLPDRLTTRDPPQQTNWSQPFFEIFPICRLAIIRILGKILKHTISFKLQSIRYEFVFNFMKISIYSSERFALNNDYVCLLVFNCPTCVKFNYIFHGITLRTASPTQKSVHRLKTNIILKST